MAEPTSEPGRPGQRRRTRSAIIAAAVELLAHGRNPSVAEIAKAAEVSRRTVYMHFPTLEQLFVDAALETISRKTINPILDAAGDGTDVEARVANMARRVQRLSAQTEQQGRTLMRLTADGDKEKPPRGYRRIEWIERAIAPLHSRLDARRFERLVSALAMVIGWEALLVQRDIRALSLTQAEELSAWAARALVRATLDEADAKTSRRATKKRTR